MYFCFWKVFSSPFLWTSENTARLSIPRRGLPLILESREKALGMGSMAEAVEEETLVNVCFKIVSKLNVIGSITE